jgi:hypothetical protein
MQESSQCWMHASSITQWWRTTLRFYSTTLFDPYYSLLIWIYLLLKYISRYIYFNEKYYGLEEVLDLLQDAYSLDSAVSSMSEIDWRTRSIRPPIGSDIDRRRHVTFFIEDSYGLRGRDHEGFWHGALNLSNANHFICSFVRKPCQTRRHWCSP